MKIMTTQAMADIISSHAASELWCLRFIMENGAKGVEVIISGKLRAQRAKAMKFR